MAFNEEMYNQEKKKIKFCALFIKYMSDVIFWVGFSASY